MWDFLRAPTFYRTVNTVGESLVLEIGYDNFTVTKPLYVPRMQTFFTWHFILSGSGTLEIAGKSFKISGGDMFFIPPNEKMRYYPDKDDPWEYVWFALNGESGGRYGEAVGFSENTFVLKNRRQIVISGILKSLFEALGKKSTEYFGVLSAFYKIMELSVSNIPPHEIQSIMEVIDNGCMSQCFSIEGLCRDVGISHAHLLRLFKAEYGQTLIGYVMNKRIEHACELLAATDLSVAEVAYSCGFSDELHFMKCFKRATGLTALKYRKENAGR